MKSKLEQKIKDSSGRVVNLLDDELLSGDDSPLRTLALIEEFISKRLQGPGPVDPDDAT